MKTKEHTSRQSPYSGFFFGMIIGGAVLYLLGTKHGRTLLTRLMKAAEELEINGEELVSELESKLNSDMDIEGFIDHLTEKAKKHEESSVSTMHSVMERIKSVIPTHEVKQYIAKDGRIVK
jgi:hypothetical protein